MRFLCIIPFYHQRYYMITFAKTFKKLILDPNQIKEISNEVHTHYCKVN
jgi:hypothetical protein